MHAEEAQVNQDRRRPHHDGNSTGGLPLFFSDSCETRHESRLNRHLNQDLGDVLQHVCLKYLQEERNVYSYLETYCKHLLTKDQALSLQIHGAFFISALAVIKMSPNVTCIPSS